MEKGFILVFLVFGFLNSAISAPQNGPLSNSKDKISRPHVKILKQINKINEDGSYTFGYEADDGSFKVETRSKNGVVKGKYGFIDPSGQLKTVEYSAGRKLPNQERDPRIAEATETEPKAIKKDSRETGTRDESSSAENNSSGGGTSGESGSVEDPAFNSFSSQVGQKDVGPPSELSKRQGQLGGPGGSGVGIGSQYAGQGQRPLGQQPYVPTTNLPGGQFRGQFVDPRLQQQGFGGPQYFQSQRPQYIGNGPQQYPSDGFGGAGPQNHYVGRQYPQGFVGGSPQSFLGGSLQQQYLGGSPQQQYIGGSPQQFTPSSAGGQGTSGRFLSQSPQLSQNQLSQDDDGFVNSPYPQQYYNGARPQQFDYNGQGGIGFGRPGQGIQPNIYQSQFGGGPQQFGGRPGFGQFPSNGAGSGGRQSYNSDVNDQQEYVPNAELDGFSEDNDQDGFVDPYPGGNGATGNKAEAADEKSPAVKTPSGEKVQNEYSPQILGPQGPGFQGRPALSPYNEQELQQIYSQPGVGAGRPQNPYPYSNQFSQFPYQSRQPQFQSNPIQQQHFSPYAGGPQYINQGGTGPFGPRGQYNPASYQGAQGFPLTQGQGQSQFIQGQASPISPYQAGPTGVPRYLNNVQANAASQFPYDYVGGVGPSGFPLGGPQSQFLQQQGQSQGPVSPTPGADQGSSESSKGNN